MNKTNRKPIAQSPSYPAALSAKKTWIAAHKSSTMSEPDKAKAKAAYRHAITKALIESGAIDVRSVTGRPVGSSGLPTELSGIARFQRR